MHALAGHCLEHFILSPFETLEWAKGLQFRVPLWVILPRFKTHYSLSTLKCFRMADASHLAEMGQLVDNAWSIWRFKRQIGWVKDDV